MSVFISTDVVFSSNLFSLIKKLWPNNFPVPCRIDKSGRFGFWFNRSCRIAKSGRLWFRCSCRSDAPAVQMLLPDCQIRQVPNRTIVKYRDCNQVPLPAKKQTGLLSHLLYKSQKKIRLSCSTGWSGWQLLRSSSRFSVTSGQICLHTGYVRSCRDDIAHLIRKLSACTDLKWCIKCSTCSIRFFFPFPLISITFPRF